MHQLGAQFFDAAVRGPGQQIVRLWDVADRWYARTRQAAAFPEESPASRVHHAGAIAASLKRVEQGSLTAAALDIGIQAPREPELDVVVDDGDNPPLELRGITARFHLERRRPLG